MHLWLSESHTKNFNVDGRSNAIRGGWTWCSATARCRILRFAFGNIWLDRLVIGVFGPSQAAIFFNDSDDPLQICIFKPQHELISWFVPGDFVNDVRIVSPGRFPVGTEELSSRPLFSWRVEREGSLGNCTEEHWRPLFVETEDLAPWETPSWWNNLLHREVESRAIFS